MPDQNTEYFTTFTSTLIEWLRLIPNNVYNMPLLCTSIKKVWICIIIIIIFLNKFGPL